MSLEYILLLSLTEKFPLLNVLLPNTIPSIRHLYSNDNRIQGFVSPMRRIMLDQRFGVQDAFDGLFRQTSALTRIDSRRRT